MATRPPRSAREMTARLTREGWNFVRRTGSGHLVFAHPVGGRVTTPSTPSDWRAVRNVMAHARRQVRQAEATRVEG